MAAWDERFSWSTAFLSSLAGIGIAASIVLLILAIRLLVRNYIAWRRGPDADTGADDDSNLPKTPHDTLPFADIPPITTVATMPRHAVSDMDRDIKFQIANCQELQDLEAAAHWKHTG
ncbi:hypothetical protein N7491_006468 [Penicillium cf. griseofulvum]|uniref:Uncharacterized protein n=1 Tax=Penicillium cf. griseofulvum TaxID=2972120 RepID=A0A9W9M359_9EURO|nr:hypothetical protein N7472_010502 [Penicillium cf. griseofulvum]KAJ5429452.1 hypothetical protein N7491_006468 [Penicillium cf. griseofulvum]KAJ5436766.1 hypothetical protein N7445_007651 [Penicillium cf. griseofulvum]